MDGGPHVATVNFSVPDDVRDAFNEAFAGRNKSAIIAELMRQAVEEERQREAREAAVERLRQRRRPAATSAAIRRAREALRG
jgi:metal-responsive CopG/Arc/MetJ family transcriptional regulator